MALQLKSQAGRKASRTCTHAVDMAIQPLGNNRVLKERPPPIADEGQRFRIQIQNPFLTAQSTQIKSVISVPIKDFIHHYPRALFNDIPRVGTHFNDIPGSGRTFTTYPGRGAV